MTAYLVVFLDLSQRGELLLHLVESPHGRVELGLFIRKEEECSSVMFGLANSRILGRSCEKWVDSVLFTGLHLAFRD